MGSRARATGDDKPSVRVMGRKMRPLSYLQTPANPNRPFKQSRFGQTRLCRLLFQFGYRFLLQLERTKLHAPFFIASFLDFRFRHCHFSRLRKRPDRQGNQRGLRHPPPFRLRFNQLHRFRRQLEVFLHDTAFLIASLLDFRS
ncbi:hypothetical protein NEILACOT_05336 [Neisseria lactamica ATCC 23970]|uniref:Uncharacterized protein n=1 Tax=Neisseria lactamica ATCC 23970 TaxID=546265 RepID=D0WCQ2_NEILA|nr:hypothetical protein NEILACOT_05336 [Neisseria lactamica ATCC 23970]